MIKHYRVPLLEGPHESLYFLKPPGERPAEVSQERPAEVSQEERPAEVSQESDQLK